MTESPEGAYASPGKGAITDATGNVFTVVVAKSQAMQNAKPMLASSNTSALIYHGHALLGQDATSHAWYKWAVATQKWAPVAAPPAAPVTTFTIATIGPQKVGTSFVVHGAFAFQLTTVALSDGATTATLTPTPEACAFSFVHPGYAKAGTYTVTAGVAGGATAQSNSFVVS